MINNKVVIDTNILIYSILEDNKYYIESRNLIKNNFHNIVLTSKNISEFIVVLTKMNIDYSTINEHLRLLKDNFKLLYPDDKSIESFYKLIDKYKPKGNKVYDIEIVSILLANGVNKIATFNKSDFQDITEIEIISTLTS